jgi:hypothetical protein
VRGGSQHDWCFHGPAFFDLAVTGGAFGPTQTQGTLAGEDIAFGEPPENPGNTSGYHGLYNVRRMNPDGLWRATWRKADEDLSMTMTMPADCAQQVIVADASPEVQPGNPDEIQYVLGRNLAADNKPLDSTFVAIVEPHKGAANVQSAQRLTAVHTPPGAVGLLVERQGETDLVHSSPMTDKPVVWHGGDDALSAHGAFAMVTVDGQGVKRAVLIDGTLLRYGDFELRAAPSPRGRVADVDLANNAIVIDTPLDDPAAWRDGVVILGNDLHSSSYTVVDATAAGETTTLRFGDTLLIIGMGAAAGIDGATVTSDRELIANQRIDGGKHAGRWLYNESRTRGFRITNISSRAFTLDSDGADLDAVFADDDGDGRRLYWISEVGPGDAYFMPRTTHFQR